MPIKDVGINPGVIVRRFYKIGDNFSENAIFSSPRLIGELIG